MKDLNKLKIILFLLSFILTGCKLPSERLSEVITPKVHNYSKTNEYMTSCSFNKLKDLILKENKNDFLKNAEVGLINYYQYNHKSSNYFLSKAINIYENYEDRPIFSISDFLKNNYQGEGYDKVFLHNYKAINYLMRGQYEDALVESRNSNLAQIQEKKRLDKFIKKNKSIKIIPSVYNELFSKVNSNINPYQNPFAYYISALTYLEDNDYDNALIDIKKALKYAPNSELLKSKLRWLENNKNIKTRQNRVELFFDVGKSPIKKAIRQNLNMGSFDKYITYLPSFEVYQSSVAYIKIVDENNKEITKSDILSDINAIKINEFREKLPTILYIYTKESSMSALTKVIEKKSLALAVLMRTTNALYSKSNISTWSSLPEKILVTSFIYSPNKKYYMLIISKNDEVIDKQVLKLVKKANQKNIYHHYTIKGDKICQKY